MTPAVPLIEQAARCIGLRLREQDLDAMTLWVDERWRLLQLSDMAHYCQLLEQDSNVGRRERELLTVRCTTGESYFFRDQGQFELLGTELLPRLMARRSSQRTLRVWSAGCASGEEAYSLAMLIDELTAGLPAWKLLVLGSDINSEALQRARQGLYREWSFRVLDDQRRQRYFVRAGDAWQIDQRLMDSVSFSQLDLLHDAVPDATANLHDFDLILCRNVFIYLDAQAIRRIKTKLSQALADDGYLLTGHNELFGHSTAPLCVQLFAQSAVYQKATAAELGTDPLAAPASPQPPTAPSVPPVPIGPSHSELMKSAWRHADGGRSDDARQDCERAIELDRLNPQPYFLLAQVAQECGDVGQAKLLMSKVIYLDPAFIAAYLALGGLHAQENEPSRAQGMYRAARAALQKVPASSVVAPYLKSTAAEVLAHVERLLAEPKATDGQFGESKMSTTRSI